MKSKIDHIVKPGWPLWGVRGCDIFYLKKMLIVACKWVTMKYINKIETK